MSTKRILFLGPKKAESYQQFFQSFLKASDLKLEDQFEIKAHPSDLDLLKDLADPYLPHLLFLDGSEDSELLSQENLLAIASSIKKLDTLLLIFYITKDLQGGSQQIQGLDHGIDAFINWNIQPQENFELLKEAALQCLTRTARRLRIPSAHKITFSLANIQQAIVAETLNLGTGGMFIRALPPNVKIGDKIDFEFLVEDFLSGSQHDFASVNPLDRDEHDATKRLKGSGLVVWVRKIARDNMPEGMGIEFSNLESDTQELFEEYVRHHKIHSFIPNS